MVHVQGNFNLYMYILIEATFLVQVKCHENVDKYLEYDTVLIILDILLHKSQAYRHVLFNVKIAVKYFCLMN